MRKNVVHQEPPKDSWKLPCCKKFVFFMPDTDMITKELTLVTCEGES